jgi:hypothetical protein
MSIHTRTLGIVVVCQISPKKKETWLGEGGGVCGETNFLAEWKEKWGKMRYSSSCLGYESTYFFLHVCFYEFRAHEIIKILMSLNGGWWRKSGKIYILAKRKQSASFKLLLIANHRLGNFFFWYFRVQPQRFSLERETNIYFRRTYMYICFANTHDDGKENKNLGYAEKWGNLNRNFNFIPFYLYEIIELASHLHFASIVLSCTPFWIKVKEDRYLETFCGEESCIYSTRWWIC